MCITTEMHLKVEFQIKRQRMESIDFVLTKM